MTGIVDEIFDLFARYGAEHYGEDLSIERHMLQSAALAQSLGAADSVVVAALLHDIGYFLQAARGDPAQAWLETPHEVLGAAWLSQAFDEDVTTPIALHVQAKRYLCAIELGYFDQLSDASRLSLSVQGGVMSEGETAAFEREPAFDAALLLRRCDDRGKDAAAEDQTVEHFRGLLTATMRRADA